MLKTDLRLDAFGGRADTCRKITITLRYMNIFTMTAIYGGKLPELYIYIDFLMFLKINVNSLRLLKQ